MRFLTKGDPMAAADRHTLSVLDAWTFPRRLDAVPDARHYIRRLAEKAIDYSDRVTDIELPAGELLGNAVSHGSGDVIGVKVTAEGRVVRVEVHDDGTEPIGAADSDPMSETGRGLLLVDAFTDQCGIDQDEHGTTAWFTVVFP